MKKALFSKPYTTKACFALIVGVYMSAHATTTHASFLSTLVSKVMGPETQAAEIAPSPEGIVHNSQTLPLPESSINPDLKNIKDEPILTMVSDDEALVSNAGPAGTDSDLEKYASTEEIKVYVVKKGDTLESIAKKLKVSKDTILSSNADLKKSDLLKIGQSLVILDSKTSSSDKTDTTTSDKDVPEKVIVKKTESDKKKDEPAKKEVVKKEVPIQIAKAVTAVAPVIPPTIPVTQTPIVKTVEAPVPTPVPQNQIQPMPTTTVVTPVATVTNIPNSTTVTTAPAQNPLPETTVTNGQPAGTIAGGYIWPFPAGVGRVSQGLHADQAYDFAAPRDTPIYAIQSGTVLIVHPTGYNGGYGKYVVINFDDGRQAIFGHMNKTVATAGQVVKQGDLIGYVGSTGQSTGNHTHIGFRFPSGSQATLGNPYKGLKVNSTSIEDHD